MKNATLASRMQAYLYSALLFLFILAFTSCEGPSDNKPATTDAVSGVILDEQQNAVPGAFVEAVNSSNVVVDTATTTENGEFTLGKLTENINGINIRVTHVDFKSFTSKLSDCIKENDKKHVSVKMLHDDDCCATVEITVKRASDSSAISGAEVRLNREKTIIRKANTNDNGHVVFEHVCSGNYWVRIAKEGFTVIEQAVQVHDCDTVRVTYYMQEKSDNDCCNGVIVFTARNHDNQVMKDVNVRLWKGNQKLAETKTNEEGKYIFRELCKGTYAISYSKDGYTGGEFTVNINCDTILCDRTLGLVHSDDTCCDGKIKIMVKNQADGSALNGATVKLWKNAQLVATKTVENGYVVFEKLCKGAYGLDITKDGFKAIEFQVEIGCNEVKEIEKSLVKNETHECCDGKVIVYAIDSTSGAKIAGATVKLRQGATVIQTATTDANGRAVFEKVCKGGYNIAMLKDGYKGIEFEFNLDCNATLEFHKKMLANQTDQCCGGRIIVYAIDSTSGAKIAGVTVKLRQGATVIQTATTDANGRAVFEKVCKGGYNIAMLKDGYKGVEFEFNLDCNATLEFHKKMLANQTDQCCGGRVIVYAIDSTSGAKIAGVTVKLRQGANVIQTATTDANGRAVFEKVCKGGYNIAMLKDGYKGVEFEFNLDCNATLEFHKKMLANHPDQCCTAILKIRVLEDGTDAYIQNARVLIYLKDQQVRDPRSNSEGWSTAEQLCAPNTYHIKVTMDGYTSKEFDMTFTECKTMQETVRLKKN